MSSWVGFVAAIEDLLQSYKQAKITQRMERSVVVSGRMVHVPEDAFRVRTVSIRAELIDDEVVIRCLIQWWNQVPKGHPLTIESEAPLDFRIEGADLLLENQRLTPAQAAERLLLKAFKS